MDRKDQRNLARASIIGMEISIPVIVGLVLGHWADGRFGTSPWLTLLGIVAGTAVALKAIMHALKVSNEEGP